jgi:hypothetical protein
MVRRRIMLLGMLLALTVAALGAEYQVYDMVHGSHAQTVQPAAVSSFVVTSIDGADVTGQTLLAGAVYEISFTLSVAEGLKENIILDTGFQKTGDIYWRLASRYAGVDTQAWQPGMNVINFQAVAGDAQFVLKGMVPADYVMEVLDGDEVLHRAGRIRLLAVSLESGVLVEHWEADVTDQSIENFRDTLKAKDELLQNSQTQPVFADLVRANLRTARSLGEKGYIDRAMEIMKTIPDGGWPASERFELILMGTTGGAGLVAVLLFLLFVRAKSASSFIRQRVIEQVRRLDLTEAKITKTGDASLAGEVGDIKAELEKASGR